MFNLLKSDVYRLVHGKMLWVATGVLVGLIVLGVVLLSAVSAPQFLYDAARMSATATVYGTEGADIDLDAAPDEALAPLADATAEDRERAMDAAIDNAAEAAAREASGGEDGTDGVDGADAAEDEYLYGMLFEDPENLTMADFEAASREMRTFDSPLDMLGDSLVSGGLLGALVALVVALFFASDFSTRFVRNLPLDRRGRVSYYGGRLVLVGLIALYFLAVGCLVSIGGFLLAGFTFATLNTVAEVVAFVGLSWLCVTAYGCLTAVLVWMSRSAGAGVAFALVVATGIAGTLVGSLLQNLGMALPVLAQIQPWLLATCMNHDLALPAASLLAAPEGSVFGMPLAVQIALVGVFWVAVSAAVSLGALRKRDV
ncbi:hypothetical protein [uncultured Adlercreutzia sp.]|uniref:hypothetical protein n=1 Tax=uncultured Adlercreutzia sp. TaxID=875803 RepID=UPI002674C133|nr:hypothetical protein [uncultured Adlercreutzia sp.]